MPITTEEAERAVGIIAASLTTSLLSDSSAAEWAYAERHGQMIAESLAHYRHQCSLYGQGLVKPSKVKAALTAFRKEAREARKAILSAWHYSLTVTRGQNVDRAAAVKSLMALNTEFPDGVLMDERGIEATTEPITLAYDENDPAFQKDTTPSPGGSVELGKMVIRISFSDLTRPGRAVSAAVRVRSLDPTRRSTNRHHHPHVESSGVPCLGEAQEPVEAVLMRGLLYDTFVIVRQMLRCYNPASAYRYLPLWYGWKCQDCGAIKTSEEIQCWCDRRSCCRVRCVNCEEHTCGACRCPCRTCGKPICAACRMSVRGGGYVCTDVACSTRCLNCRTRNVPEGMATLSKCKVCSPAAAAPVEVVAPTPTPEVATSVTTVVAPGDLVPAPVETQVSSLPRLEESHGYPYTNVAMSTLEEQ